MDFLFTNNNTAYFSRLFKKKEGISPSEYREKYTLN
ncbi:AraC family transcriptional regulator [Flavobacteriaceae bacterium]|nr:AraC family transcriptional regulator [Flavobacteriaceae bacterium]